MCIPTSIAARQLLGKHVPMTTNTHAIIEQLLGIMFFIRSPSYQRKVCVPMEQLGKHVPVTTKAKESPVLEAATK
jgi:hypothetical protein